MPSNFLNGLIRFAARTEAKVHVYGQEVQTEALAEMERRLGDALPSLTPSDTGALARGYKFRIENGELVVSNDEFYALAISRFGNDYDLIDKIVTEAEKIINSQGFRYVVHERSLARARLG